MIRKLARRIYRIINGSHVSIKRSIDINHLWYGSNYGGFFVHPDSLNESSIVYSFGIGEDITFDLALIKTHGCSVFGFDPTPKSINWIGSQKSLPDGFKFHPFGIGAESGERIFFLPHNPNHVSGSILQQKNVDSAKQIQVTLKSMQEIISLLQHQRIDVLKMDIEGAEYEVIPGILNSGIEINQILIEFHHRMISHGKMLTKNAISMLKKYNYGIFGVSENGDEVSFIKLSKTSQ